MGKKLTPLEALNELRNNYVPVFHSRRMGKQQVVKSFAIIENALKEREELKKCLKSEIEHSAFLNRERLKDSKKLKALDVIKEKKVNVGSFVKCCANIDYEEYINGWGNWKKDILYNLSSELLTQKEYDLLKEILFYAEH